MLEALDALVPGLLETLPADPFTGEAFPYARTPEGCRIGRGEEALALPR